MLNKSLPCFLLTVILLIQDAVAASEEPRYYNSNLLSAHNIPPEILDLPMRFFDQNLRASMLIHVEIADAEGKTMQSGRFELVSDPHGPAGVEAYIRLPEGQTLSWSKRQLENLLEDHMGLHFVSRQATHLYDENSLELISESPGETIIGFRYIPQLIFGAASMLRNANGRIILRDGEISELIISVDEPYWSGNTKIIKSETRYRLSKVPDAHGYLIDSFDLIEIENNGTTVTTRGQVITYTDEAGKPVTWKSGRLPDLPDLGNTTTIRINLDRPLPFWGKEVRKMGFQLPRTYGLQLFAHFQDETMLFTDFQVEGVDVSDFVTPDGSSTRNKTRITAVRADVWVLPFMSVNVMLGKAMTDSEITLKGGPIGVPDPDDPIFGDDILAPGELMTFTEKLDTEIAGIGGTIGFGFHNLFTALDIMYVNSITSSVSVEMDALAITPTIGYTHNPWRARFMLGGQYQEFDLIIKGQLPGIGSFEVGQALDRWTYLLGVQKEFFRNWGANLMLADGKSRRSATLLLEYRF